MDWSKLIVPEISGLKSYVPGITEEKLQREFGLSQVIKLSSNETPIEPSPMVAAAMQEALKKVNRYPDQQALLDMLAAQFSVASENVMLGNGSIDVIEALLRTFVGRQNNVILSQYGYIAYAPFVTAQGAQIRVAQSTEDLGHDVDQLLGQINAQTRMIVIDNPTNLSGAMLDIAQLNRLLDAVPDDVIVILDEAYVEFVVGTHCSQTARLPLQRPNLVITRTFSKAFGLAGMRVGFALAHAEILRAVSRIRPPFPVGRVSLAAAAAALRDTQHLHQIVETVLRGREFLSQQLRDLGISVVASNGNFVLADFAGAGRSVYEGLLQQGIITRAMSSYGLSSRIRISIGTESELTQLLSAIRGLLARQA